MRKLLQLLVIVMVLCVWAQLGRAQQQQPIFQPPAQPAQRGALGLLNWRQTNTYPSVPWPSLPSESTRGLCVTSDTNTGVVAAAVVPAAPEIEGRLLGAIIVGALLIGSLWSVGLTIHNIRRRKARTAGKTT